MSNTLMLQISRQQLEYWRVMLMNGLPETVASMITTVLAQEAGKVEPVAFPGYPPVPEDRKLPVSQPAPVSVVLGEPVAIVMATGGPHDKEDRVLCELQAELPPIGTKLYAIPPTKD